MAEPHTSPTTVKSAMRTLDIIEYVVAQPAGVVAQEIAVALAIPVSSLSYLLSTLVDREYLRRDGRRYCAGSGLDRLRRSDQPRSLVDRARPLVRALRTQLNESASLFEIRGWELEAVVTETADQALRYSIEVGRRTPLHCVAAGKALLAAMPGAQLDDYFAQQPRAAFTEHTLCDEAALRRDLEATRTVGHARSREEYVIGISAIGFVIGAGASRGATAAVSVAVPTPRFTPEFEQKVVDHTRRIAGLLDGDALALAS